MTSLAMTLQTAIDAWGEQQRQSPLIELARRGELTPQALALYLTSLQELFIQSQANLREAGTRAAAQGRSALAQYFREKARDELGHEQWAASDLAKLPGRVTHGRAPGRGCWRLSELQRQLLDEDPLCFAVYVVWAEYLTVLLGEEWLAALAVSGYERSGLSAVSNHVEADRDHASHGFAALDALWTGEPALKCLMASLERAERVFEEFCLEICQESQRTAATCVPMATVNS